MRVTSRIAAIRAQILRALTTLTPSDGFALLLLAVAIPYLFLFPRTAVIEDFWYHLALGHWIAQTKELFLFDPVSFQPFSRPQVYPLGVHTLVGLSELLAGSAILGSIILRIVLYVGTLATTWWAGRTLVSPFAGYLALLLVATDQAMFYSAWSLMPAGVICLLVVLLVLALHRRRFTLAGLLLLSTFSVHLVLPWLVTFGVVIAAWALPDLRRGIWRVLGIGILPTLPFLGFVLWHSNHFWIEKSISYNPIPGYGPFGYASHYHLGLAIVVASAFGIFHLLIPMRRGLATLLSILPLVAVVFIGIPHLPIEIGKMVRFLGRLLPGDSAAAESAAGWWTWLDGAIHPMLLLNIGTVAALTALLAGATLAVWAIAPNRFRGFTWVLGGSAAVATTLAFALAFNVEMDALRLWDGMLLALGVLALAVAFSASLHLSLGKRLGSIPPMLGGIAAAAVVGGATSVLAPVVHGAQLWVPFVATLCILVGLTGGIAWALPCIGCTFTTRPPRAGLLALAFILGLLPMLPTYGGRYFWHITPLLALLAVLHLPTKPLTHEQRVRFPIPVRSIALAYLIVVIAINWPLFAYSRGFRRELLPQDTPVGMAYNAANPAEYEQPDFLRLVAWVREHTDPTDIVHTDDPRTAHMLTIFADRVADNGMFWESQTRQLQDLVAGERRNGVGVFVYTGTLPEALATYETIGKWKVVVGGDQPPSNGTPSSPSTVDPSPGSGAGEEDGVSGGGVETAAG